LLSHINHVRLVSEHRHRQGSKVLWKSGIFTVRGWLGLTNVGTGTCEEIEFQFFAGDRKCIANRQRSLVGHLIAKSFEAQTRLLPNIRFLHSFLSLCFSD
jgi:hypothetical protein